MLIRKDKTISLDFEGRITTLIEELNKLVEQFGEEASLSLDYDNYYFSTVVVYSREETDAEMLARLRTEKRYELIRERNERELLRELKAKYE